MRETRLPGHLAWWTIALVWWTLDGLTSATHYHLMAQAAGTPVGWGHALGTAMVSAFLWVPLTVLALWLAERFPLERDRWRRHLPAHLAATVGVCLFRAGVVVVLNPWVGWYVELPDPRHLLFTSVRNNLFLFWLLIGIGHGLHYARRYRERERALIQAELSALKMQLHPHFLFNTLNAVSSFVRTDPDAAERMIARLSELLRHALDSAGTQEVALEEELRFLRPYLEIERTRFEDRLRVRWSIDPAAREARVPHLILQPLVENSIRHGIAPRAAPGVVEIQAERRDGDLCLRVRDDGVGIAEGVRWESARGVGLANTRARLRQLYGDRHRLTVETPPGGGTCVTLTLPFHADEEADR